MHEFTMLICVFCALCGDSAFNSDCTSDDRVPQQPPKKLSLNQQFVETLIAFESIKGVVLKETTTPIAVKLASESFALEATRLRKTVEKASFKPSAVQQEKAAISPGSAVIAPGKTVKISDTPPTTEQLKDAKDATEKSHRPTLGLRDLTVIKSASLNKSLPTEVMIKSIDRLLKESTGLNRSVVGKKSLTLPERRQISEQLISWQQILDKLTDQKRRLPPVVPQNGDEISRPNHAPPAN